MDDSIQIYTFKNGIRLVYSFVPGADVTHCGFIINCGSRDENNDEVGMAHFIEHMLFKGTEKRKSFHILNRMDSVGAELNAYTSKEKTCIYSACQNIYFDRAVELLTDITFHSTFPQHEMEKEKKVISDEIIMYEDNPEESIFDDFLARFYAQHTLGYNILGTREGISKFKGKQLKNFIQRNYHTNQMVFSVVTSLPFNSVLKSVEKYISEIKKAEGKTQRQSFKKYKTFEEKISKDFVQSHCIIGGKAYPIVHKNKYAIALLNNLLGGPGMNSRLNLAIREKYGFCYQINSDVSTYEDSGVFNVYFGTEAGYMEKCIELVEKELKKLRDTSLSTSQLNNAKKQLTGQMALSEENRSGLMLALGRSLLDTGKIFTREALFRQIYEVSSSQVLEVANDILNPKGLSKIVYN